VPHVSRVARWFVGAYVAFYPLVAFWHWPLIDPRINAYPFTAFPMFASVRAVAPDDTHQGYEVLEGGCAVTSDPASPDLARWIRAEQHGARRWNRLRSPARVQTILEQLRARATAAVPAARIQTVRLTLRAHRAAPHPAPARFDEVEVATIGELAADGTFTHRLGRLERAAASWAVRGLPPGDHRLAAYQDGALTELAAAREGDRWHVTLPAGPVQVFARVGERWFLVADKRRP
jgi:hypothetical protein